MEILPDCIQMIIYKYLHDLSDCHLLIRNLYKCPKHIDYLKMDEKNMFIEWCCISTMFNSQRYCGDKYHSVYNFYNHFD